ncbi:MAG: LD-carboxypeptidase [Phycisphaerae bacterium]|jgi:muramoyltetrapeptide carboxypeptidase
MRRIAFTSAALGFVCATVLRGEGPPPIFPPALRPGDTVQLVAPAGSLERSRVELARTRLTRMGFHVRVPENLFRKRGYLAGDDDVRAEELMAAFRDPTVRAVLPGAGGYGTTRLLDLLDYEAIRQNPKVLLGYSDITGLHLAIQRKTGLVTFHGPVVSHGLGSRENLTGFSRDYLWRALLYRSYFDWAGQLLDEGYTYELPPALPELRALSSGRAAGRLTGGNLSLVCALMGTAFEVQTAGRVLFIEDTNEEPYRIDRYLSQLRLGGKFDRVSAVILGQFTNCESRKGEDSLSLEQVLADYFEGLGVPVIANFPAGHSRFNATLPINALVEVDADARRVRLLENPVQLGEPGQTLPPDLAAPEVGVEPDVVPEPTATAPARAGLPDNGPDPASSPASAPARPIDDDLLRRIP